MYGSDLRYLRGPFVTALGKNWCPDHFHCATDSCRKPLIDVGFVEEQGNLYCEDCYEKFLAPTCGKCDKRIKGVHWNDLFTTKCVGCGFPIEAGDRWVEALNNNYHSQCFKCSVCKSNLEGKSFYAKNGRPFCKSHAGR
ncbi:hypothetical protein HAZT_HAZT004270 [Hyalella azteca]|uniref:LIM zinc-binding domain-containing protein n=1 Tax=Hyalella azteca TaxID=294128 RepID=A0A6A0HBZ1_HYAAZ|nr:hypothetical protein HAZT_HAZT004270 [Hyalella azteca]